MGQCRTLDADVTIECYYGDYSSCDNTFPTSLFVWNECFPSHYMMMCELMCSLFVLLFSNDCINSSVIT